jgi:putative transposase
MARISRVVAPGYPHHITQRGVRSLDVFQSDNDRDAYLCFLSEETARYDVEILSWCLMTNHVHFVAVPHNDKSLARAFGEAHRRYTRMKNFAENVRGYLFQGRFGSCVLDEYHLMAAVRYIELNPVRAGIVRYAWEYPWSSARFHMGIIETDPLVKDQTLFGLVVDWQDFLFMEDITSSDRLRLATRTGRPTGGEGFIDKIQNLTGRTLQKGKSGRRRKSVKS